MQLYAWCNRSSSIPNNLNTSLEAAKIYNNHNRTLVKPVEWRKNLCFYWMTEEIKMKRETWKTRNLWRDDEIHLSGIIKQQRATTQQRSHHPVNSVNWENHIETHFNFPSFHFSSWRCAQHGQSHFLVTTSMIINNIYFLLCNIFFYSLFLLTSLDFSHRWVRLS